ncbi:hypothetical protein NE237_013017 [Protea cynaroides]|uniref:Uncharacterized protein n=1 Tax=Protea cynaroides TaxID=273540 RepID=A0A9Q0GZ21_9MAGN|nr:hypothetical protein NE237_013017 [Protea cynaroides]
MDLGGGVIPQLQGTVIGNAKGAQRQLQLQSVENALVENRRSLKEGSYGPRKPASLIRSNDKDTTARSPISGHLETLLTCRMVHILAVLFRLSYYVALHQLWTELTPRSKAKTNFPLTSDINNNTNNQQSPNQSSTVESSSREGFSLAPPLALDLCGGSGGGSCVGSSGGFTMRSSFHHHPHPHHQQFGVFPTVHPFFFFDPFVRSENKNMNHHHLSFDPVVTATADFQAAFAGGINGAQSDSDSSI